jgi:hypothetical protein
LDRQTRIAENIVTQHCHRGRVSTETLIPMRKMR